MATEKQIEANRHNALKSTGPKTEEGKAKVAQNGQSETPELLVVVARRFYPELQPKGPTERLLLDMIITAGWRLMRLSTLEAAGLDREYEKLRNSNTAPNTIPVRANMAHRNLCDNSRSLAARGKIAAKPMEHPVCN